MNAKNGFSAKGLVTALLALVLGIAAGAATAEIVSTDQVQADREAVQQFLSRGDVEERLKQLGVTPEEAKRRVDAMTPEEVRMVAGKIDTLAAGGAISSTDWIIILLVVVIVLLIV